MEGFFFVISELWWINHVNWLSIIIALLWGLSIVVSLEYQQQKKISATEKDIKSYKFKIIDPTDLKYAEQTLSNIRQYLAHKHNPMQSWAHVPLDIRTYTTDTELIDIIEVLEQMEFSGKNTEQHLKESINTQLLRKL
jgi:hypothetical protein